MADVEEGWLEEGVYDADQMPQTNDNDYAAPPVRVHIVATESEQVAPQLAIHSTIPIPQSGVAGGTGSQPNVARVLTHNYHRFKALMQVTPGIGCTAVVTSYKLDSLTNPVPSGATFTVNPTLAGFALQQSIGTLTPAIPATTQSVQNITGVPVYFTLTGGTGVSVAVNGTTVQPTAGLYVVPAYGVVTLTYTTAPTWAWTAVPAIGNPFYLPTYEAQRPLYMVALGGPATLSVWDEAYPVVVK